MFYFLLFVIFVGFLIAFAPRPWLDSAPRKSQVPQIPLPQLTEWLDAQESRVPNLVDGTAAHIEWANPDADFYSRVITLMTEHPEECRGFGLDWMNDRLQRVSRHDHRLATAISMLDRQGVIAGARPPECFEIIATPPDMFRDDEFLAEKKRRDQERLYGMVELASEQEDRKAFLNRYFLGSSEDHS